MNLWSGFQGIERALLYFTAFMFFGARKDPRFAALACRPLLRQVVRGLTLRTGDPLRGCRRDWWLIHVDAPEGFYFRQAFGLRISIFSLQALFQSSDVVEEVGDLLVL